MEKSFSIKGKLIPGRVASRRVLEIAGRRDLGALERITLGTRVLGVLPMTVHCYRVGSTLVDAGPPNRADELAELVDREAIEHVVLTHHHEDHVGGARTLAEAGATVHAPEASLDPLEDPPTIEPYQHRVWGQPHPIEAQPLGDALETPDLRLDVRDAAGHSPDHVVLFEPDRGWLFAGDAYLPPRDTLRADEELAGFLDSLQRIHELDIDRLFPGHGSVVDTPASAIDEVLEHFETLKAQARELADDGHDPRGVRRRLLGVEGLIRYYTGGHYAKQNLVDELLALA